MTVSNRTKAICAIALSSALGLPASSINALAQTRNSSPPPCPMNFPDCPDLAKKSPSQTTPVPTTDSSDSKVDALNEFMIRNVFMLQTGATLLSYNISQFSFRIDVAGTTSDPDGLYNSLINVFKVMDETITKGVDSFPDGNIAKLDAAAKKVDSYKWNGFPEESTHRLLATEHRKFNGCYRGEFNGCSYQVFDAVVGTKRAGLTDDTTLYDIFRNGRQNELIAFATAEFITTAHTPKERIDAVAKQTHAAAKDIAETLYRIHLAYQYIEKDGLNHSDKTPQGTPVFFEAIKIGENKILQDNILGQQAALRIVSGANPSVNRTLQFSPSQ